MDEAEIGKIPQRYDWRTEVLKEGAMKEQDIIICGHGSGRPSTKNMRDYLSTRYSTYAKSNGKRKQLVAVRRLKTLTDQGRAAAHDLYRSILGRNYYSQDRREYVYHPHANGLSTT